MRGWIIRRLATAGIAVMGIIFLQFCLIRLPAGGTPTQVSTSRNQTAEQIQEHTRQYRKIYHLDEPLPTQFGRWISSVITLDLGTSMSDNQAVSDKVGSALGVTLPLQLAAILLIFGAGVPLGVLMATRHNRVLDRIFTILTLALYSLPGFFLATLLLQFLSTETGTPLFPLEKLHSAGSDQWGLWRRIMDTAWHGALPVTVLTAPGIAVVARYTRNSLIEVLGSEHVRTARAAGLPERTVIWKYALRCALTPVVTLFGAMVPTLIGGSIIVENIFNLRGMGRLLYDATFELDYPTLQALFLLTAVLTLLGYLLSDILSAILDPRVRLQ